MILSRNIFEKLPIQSFVFPILRKGRLMTSGEFCLAVRETYGLSVNRASAVAALCSVGYYVKPLGSKRLYGNRESVLRMSQELKKIGVKFKTNIV